MLSVAINDDHSISFGDRFRLSLQRTLRIPDDGQTYPLPPTMGSFELHNVADYAESLPATWVEAGGVFIAMYQFEALWLAFDAEAHKPNAVQVCVGGVNVVDGSVSAELTQSPQNYLVAPPQPWLDGINVDEHTVRQFVAVPLGKGHTVEAQVKGEETLGGIQIKVFEPKAGIFPDEPPPIEKPLYDDPFESIDESFSPAKQQMGVGAGGQMTQKIYDDPHGVDVWDCGNFAELNIFIVNSMQFHAMTGMPAPATPWSAEMYSLFGFPWFELFDEEIAAVAGGQSLGTVKSVQALAADDNEQVEDETSLPVDDLIKREANTQSNKRDNS